ncbi:hypothetical protein DFH09DRAFT_1354514 [Mycena vulgaris]|nr:hypothetical protein DFH09DRAFT_1354514 [Mycena vulgaris]
MTTVTVTTAPVEEGERRACAFSVRLPTRPHRHTLSHRSSRLRASLPVLPRVSFRRSTPPFPACTASPPFFPSILVAFLSPPPILIGHSRPFRLLSSLPHVPPIMLPSPPPSRLAFLLSRHPPARQPPPLSPVRPSFHGASISRASFFLA